MRMMQGDQDASNENDEHKSFMKSTQKRMQRAQKNQNKAMPKCTGGTYEGPRVITHKAEKPNNSVVTNETHSKATNNGFSRGAEGRFYAH